MTRLLIVRHGETDWNVIDRVQGHEDISLNERGRAQAAAAAEGLRDVPIAAVYASDLDRAAETARILARPHGLSVSLTPCLRERHWGTWQGQTLDELEATDSDLVGRWRRHEWVTPEAAEEYKDLQERVVAGLRRIAEQHEGETVLIATHGGSVKVFVASILGAPLTAHSAMRLNNVGVTTVLVRDGRYILDSYNVTYP